MLGRGLQNLLASSRRRLAPRAAAAVVQGAAHRSLCDGAPAANPPGELHPQRKLLRLKKEELVSTARALGLPTTGSKFELAERISLERAGAQAAAAAAPEPDDDVATMKVADLRARLKALGSSAAGNKADLKFRLRAHLFLSTEDGEGQPDGGAPRPPGLKHVEAEAVNGSSGRAPSRPRHAASTSAQAPAAAARPRPPAGSAVPRDQGTSSVEGEAKVSVSGGGLGLNIVVDKTQKRKGADELGMTRAERAVLLNSRVLSLYRRCLRSAERCPDEKWQETMLQYVRGRFRDSSSDAVPLRLSLGEAELLEMETYHKAREEAVFRRQQEQGDGQLRQRKAY